MGALLARGGRGFFALHPLGSDSSGRAAQCHAAPLSLRGTFEGEVATVTTRERVENRHEQADGRGKLELIENRRTWMLLELEDEEGYLGRVAFPMEKNHKTIRAGTVIRCLVLSERKDFSRIGALSDAWLPGLRMWVGEYPYLLRPAFEELCRLRLSRAARN